MVDPPIEIDSVVNNFASEFDEPRTPALGSPIVERASGEAEISGGLLDCKAAHNSTTFLCCLDKAFAECGHSYRCIMIGPNVFFDLKAGAVNTDDFEHLAAGFHHAQLARCGAACRARPHDDLVHVVIGLWRVGGPRK